MIGGMEGTGRFRGQIIGQAQQANLRTSVFTPSDVGGHGHRGLRAEEFRDLPFV